MKRISIRLLIVIFTFLIGVTATTIWIFKHHNNPINKTSKTETYQTIKTEKLNAIEVIEAFKKAALPIDKVVFRTQETDFENLLGKPNQYIEKADWIDTRIRENSRDNHVGGVIEVFETKDALESRSKQIKEIERATGIENYHFIHKNVLLRLDSILNKQQAYDYEIVFKSL